MNSHHAFVGGRSGAWRVSAQKTIAGEGLPTVTHIDLHRPPPAALPDSARWQLRGFTSNLRYAHRDELEVLRTRQEALGRPSSRCAALIPIRKTPEWWAMPQDERRALFETVSQHTRIGLDYLPAIARQLHHARDLGEPFDFLTWFEFAPEHAPAFDELLARLRATPEWSYVDREIEFRLEATP